MSPAARSSPGAERSARGCPRTSVGARWLFGAPSAPRWVIYLHAAWTSAAPRGPAARHCRVPWVGARKGADPARCRGSPRRPAPARRAEPGPGPWAGRAAAARRSGRAPRRRGGAERDARRRRGRAQPGPPVFRAGAARAGRERDGGDGG